MHVTTQAPQTYKYAGVVPTLGPSHTPGALSLQPCPHSGLPGHGALPCSTDTGLEDLRVTYPLGRCISIRWKGQRGQGRTWELAGMCACRAPLKVLGGAGGGAGVFREESKPPQRSAWLYVLPKSPPSQWTEARGEQFQRPSGARVWPGAGPLPAGSSRPDLANLIHFSSCHTLSLCLPVSGV